MLLNFINVMLVFSVGILLVNIAAVILNRRWLWFVITTIVELLFVYLVLYIQLPPKNLTTLLNVNILLAGVAAIINFIGNAGLSAVDKVRALGQHERHVKVTDKQAHFLRRYLLVLLAPIVLWLIIGATAFVTRLTSINNVYDSIPTQTKRSAELLTSAKDMPIALAPDTAKRKMQQKFSVIPNSNMYKLDGITAQMVNGEYVYVATVEFNGFFKWLKNKSVPGYFIISATDVNAQPKFVTERLKYTTSAYLNDDAARKIYAHAPTYASTGRMNLEIDDQGKPYYVQTLYREYGVSGRMKFNEFKTAVLNAQTGEVKIYDANHAPQFIDAPITSAAANQMNEFYGRYQKGWWNQTSFGAKRNVKIPTNNGVYSGGQITPLIDAKGHLVYFTDFTSGNNDQDSALGYSLIDAKTGKLTYYRDTRSGLMDSDGAISIADKIYPEKKWQAHMPILYNIDGTPTWVVSLLDTKGIFKKYVYINAIDNDIVIDGDNAQESLDDYRKDLAESTSNNRSTDPKTEKEITGKVSRVATINDGKKTIVNFMLENQATVFKIDSDSSPTVVFLKVGDEVSFKANLLDNAKIATIDDMTIKGLK
ncbi:DNA-binding protein [Leuconostoc gelidum subsp. gasicomitatum]|uniref:DNA-binding protein n=1 Tax=Leuconostoc gasicomitatum TaxID=115778 RepID=UPI001CC7D217|nr:DNA-binding protein [Leuconostoc gasicomitatum]MBZ5961147.1 DNA-binding protein [Leuconostoc gasicomitatum]MBZ5993578.1 DNA-binding protein [Leuconostoc gasicomitatum]